jgi:hypothetical protein
MRRIKDVFHCLKYSSLKSNFEFREWKQIGMGEVRWTGGLWKGRNWMFSQYLSKCQLWERRRINVTVELASLSTCFRQLSSYLFLQMSQNRKIKIVINWLTLISFNSLSGVGVQLGPLGTATTDWPIVPAPSNYDDGEFGGMKIGRGYRSTRRKPAPAPLSPPQILLDQTRDRTRAAAVGSQRLTAWAMTRPWLILRSEVIMHNASMVARNKYHCSDSQVRMSYLPGAKRSRTLPVWGFLFGFKVITVNRRLVQNFIKVYFGVKVNMSL